jgi:hypothetical protein
MCGHHYLRRDVLVKDPDLAVCALLLSRETGRRRPAEMEEAWLEAYAFISCEMERGFREEAPEG